MSAPQPNEDVEYSSRDLKPASLLTQDLLRAHNTFLLLHDASLSSLFARSRRTRFVALLMRYWDLFLSTWNVSLHGNPARSIFGGINMAASGELGVGVGEEERGSGEREVLEGLVGRIEGLVDVVVSRFGEDDETVQEDEWLATGRDPGHEDGLVFAGTGAVSRTSLRDLTHWMEDMYTWGENAYGVIESPTSTRARRKLPKKDEEPPPKPEPPDLRNDSKNPKDFKGKTLAELSSQQGTAASQGQEPALGEEADGKMDKFVNILKLGYGTYWSLGTSPSESSIPPESSKSKGKEAPPRKITKRQPSAASSKSPTADDTSGYFLIGLKGTVEEYPPSDYSSDDSGPEVTTDTRTVLRAVHVELTASGLDSCNTAITGLASARRQQQSGAAQPTRTKLRVVVYANKPFLFLFLFNTHTVSLELSSMYRSLHYQLAPLRKPLLQSTAYRPMKPDGGTGSVFDLVWDQESMGVHCAIPNIPDSTTQSWSRSDALGVHGHLLNVYAATRFSAELERTAKTNRGWWVIWTRILARPSTLNAEGSNLSTIHESESDRAPSDDEDEGDGRGKAVERKPSEVSKEIFLVRKASDHAGSRGFSSSFAEAGGGGEAGRLTQGMGIGVDTRRYIEGLLGLDRYER